jgi:hypothetical protein
VSLGSQTKTLSNNATEDVSGKKPGDFMKCYELLSAFTSSLLSGTQKKCCINIDASVRKANGILSVIPMSGPPAWSDSAHLAKPSFCYSLLPGQYPFQVHITEQGKSGQTIYKASLNPVIRMGVNDTAYVLSLKNDSTLVLH